MQEIRKKSKINVSKSSNRSPFLLDLNSQKKTNNEEEILFDVSKHLETFKDFNFHSFLDNSSKYTHQKLDHIVGNLLEFKDNKLDSDRFLGSVLKHPAFFTKTKKPNFFIRLYLSARNTFLFYLLALFIKTTKHASFFLFQIIFTTIFSLKFIYHFFKITFVKLRHIGLSNLHYKEIIQKDYKNLKNYIAEKRKNIAIAKLTTRKLRLTQKSSITKKVVIKKVKPVKVKRDKKRYSFSFSTFFKSLFPEFNFRIIKSTISFAILVIILVLPLKGFLYFNELKTIQGRVLGVTEDAFASLKNGAKNAKDQDFSNARVDFSNASVLLGEAKDEINFLENFFNILGSIVPHEKAKLASEVDLILEAGIISSKIAEEISLAGDFWKNKNDSVSVGDLINFYDDKLKSITILSDSLNEILGNISTNSIPEKYREYLDLVKNNSDSVNDKVEELSAVLSSLKVFLGIDYDKRYLLVFQNNAEMRASGGFIGSYAVVDMRNSKIINMDVPGGGSYDTEAGLYEKIIAPAPLHLVNPLWHFWDANWWPDWETTAKKLEWFYERSDKSTVDGVITLTPTVIENLLEYIGPIDMQEDYGEVIDSENFWIVTQTFSEQKEDVTDKPKKIIGDLMAKIIEKVSLELDKELLIDITKSLLISLEEKQIMLFSHDEAVQEKLVEYDWAGKIKNTDSDYLMVINSNIAGGKSDRDIEEHIVLDSEILNDGSIVNTLRIKRKHNATRGQVFTGVRNVDWLRVYVPLGSELLEVDGFSSPDKEYFSEPEDDWKHDSLIRSSEYHATVDMKSKTKIYEESGKTVFANWTQLEPEEEIEIKIKYKLPFTVDDYNSNDSGEYSAYSLLLQKQPGSIATSYNTTVKIPKTYTLKWLSELKAKDSNQNLEFSGDLNTDKFFTVLLSK